MSAEDQGLEAFRQMREAMEHHRKTGTLTVPEILENNGPVTFSINASGRTMTGWADLGDGDYSHLTMTLHSSGAQTRYVNGGDFPCE